MGLMLQMPSFTKLLIMKYTPLVSTEKEFELWFDPLMVLSTLSASKAVLSCGIITFCDELYFFAKKCFSGIASWLSDNARNCALGVPRQKTGSVWSSVQRHAEQPAERRERANSKFLSPAGVPRRDPAASSWQIVAESCA